MLVKVYKKLKKLQMKYLFQTNKKFLILSGISSTLVDPHSFGITIPPKSQGKTSRQHEPIRRFACPVGFFRLKRFCYYLSAGTAPWREAYFHCKDRNATLAVLDRNGKDRMLRKYLMGDQFSKYNIYRYI